jgi:hypothetical protein
VNRNGQVVVRNTGVPGTDFGAAIYQLGCSICGEMYGANGGDIFEPKYPGDGGRPGDCRFMWAPLTKIARQSVSVAESPVSVERLEGNG